MSARIGRIAVVTLIVEDGPFTISTVGESGRTVITQAGVGGLPASSFTVASDMLDTLIELLQVFTSERQPKAEDPKPSKGETNGKPQ